MKSYVKCVNVNHEFFRIEDYDGNHGLLNLFFIFIFIFVFIFLLPKRFIEEKYHNSIFWLVISLNVRGCKTLRDSFRDYVREETNMKYQVKDHGLQVS